jgi:hypothetical protein
MVLDASGLYDLRGIWQSPRVLQVVKTIHAALPWQRSRVRVSSSPPSFPAVIGRDTDNSDPQLNPQALAAFAIDSLPAKSR